ncbi:hypothetical protein D047_3300A, partial [Vibrio parahaemolyticus VPTS-2010_2]
MKSAFLRSG